MAPTHRSRTLDALLRMPLFVSAPCVAAVINTPGLRRRFWRAWYDWISGAEGPLGKAEGAERMVFLNYGFADGTRAQEEAAHQTILPDLPPRTDRLQASMARLYQRVIEGASLSLRGLRTLEIGCGRGGGAYFVARRYGPADHVGLDLSEAAVRFCKTRHPLDNLRFIQGDATDLPFEDGARDVVINVESSHCYPDTRRFLREVRRVLRPNGVLAFADFRPKKHMPSLLAKLRQEGFELVDEEDITANVALSLAQSSEDREAWLQRAYPPSVHAIMRSFAGVRGTLVPRLFDRRSLLYTRFIARRI